MLVPAGNVRDFFVFETPDLNCFASVVSREHAERKQKEHTGFGVHIELRLVSGSDVFARPTISELAVFTTSECED